MNNTSGMNLRAAWPDFSVYRPPPPAATLIEWIADTGSTTRAWLGDLAGEAVLGPRHALLNPPQWEVGHLAWFWEKWLLRDGGAAPSGLLGHTDALYDSMAVAQDTRWDLALLPWQATWAYLDDVLTLVRKRLSDEVLADELAYFTQLCVFHQDMHNEAFAIRRRMLGDLPVSVGLKLLGSLDGDPAIATDVRIPAGCHVLGAHSGAGFVFDNEKWAHAVSHDAFAISSLPVSQGEFAAFVDHDGYRQRRYWSAAGWAWRARMNATHPACWRARPTGWQQRVFDNWQALQTEAPVVHVNAHEAEAWCAWAGRRLPGEVEWEAAWPHLHARGRVWEWTSSIFAPYAGFSADPYAEYSAPWFDGSYRVLRGGSIATAPRNLWRTWRNFYTPERSDMFCGFRTCTLV